MCFTRDILRVLSPGPPEVTGLHLPSYSLQRGLQTGCISVLPLPPHQQKTNIFLRTLNSQYQMYLHSYDGFSGLLHLFWMRTRLTRFLQQTSQFYVAVFNLRLHQTAKFEPFQFLQTDKLKLNTVQIN